MNRNPMQALALLAATAVFCAGLFGPSAAEAAKPSIITKFPGETSVVRASPTSNWLACWTLTKAGEYTLYVINGENGEKKEVVKAAEPGGICWIPGKDKLLYCKGVPAPGSTYSVTYYAYDTVTAKSKKLMETKDKFQTFMLDPIAADDGSKIFHMTISPPPTSLPSFNIYFPANDSMIQSEVAANISTDYDLSADGEKVYWYLRDESNGYLYITAWSLVEGRMMELYEYPKRINPADGYLQIRVDAPGYQAAVLAASESDPTLQLCVYGFQNEKKLTVVPLHLNQGEELLHFDWKDRNGNIYALIHNNVSGTFSIAEIGVLDGSRTQLVESQDELVFCDYSPRSNTYYYPVVDKPGTKDAQTLILRLR